MGRRKNYCADCGKAIDRRATRCKSCALKLCWAEGKQRCPKREPKFCVDCGKKISYGATRCQKCCMQLFSRRNLQSELVKKAWADGRFGDSWKEKQSKLMKDRWANGVFDEAVKGRSESAKAAWRRGRRITSPKFGGTSKLEKSVEGWFKENSIICKSQYRIGDYRRPYDIYVPSACLLIEVDGEFWHHSDWAVNKGMDIRDKEKTDFAVRNGYRIERIREGDISSCGLDVVLEEIIEKYRII